MSLRDTAFQSRKDIAHAISISDQSLRYFLFSVRPENMYSSFEVPKKNGGKRHIDAPDIRLKNIQRSLARLLMSLYLIMLRIEYAKKLLLTTDLPIEEVIWQCGYSNKGFFYKKFKESTGLNPMRFRASGSSLL